jgi:gas vesicle protein
MSFAEKYGKKSSSRTADALKKDGNSIEELAKKKKQSAAEVGTKSANADLIYLVKGIDDERNAWYYVLVERLKVSLFLKALNDDIIHLENYGVILYSAYGDEPPKEITDKVKLEYGVSD